MPRNLPSPMIAPITSNNCAPVIMVDLTLKASIEYVWSGIGLLVYGGNTYKGVGSLGSVGDISEGCDVKASGTSIALSGIDPSLFADCLSDIKLGAPATIWLGVFDAGAIVARYPIFVGTVDRPVIPIAPDTLTMTLNLETRMTNLQRASNRRYTTTDQMYYFADDSGFNWVETLNDIALIWG